MRLYIGCDAGPLHLAAAAGLPTISLFVTSHPLRYAPLGAAHRALLLGDASRSLARAPLSAARDDASADTSPVARGSFRARLCAERPQLVVPTEAGAAAEVELVAAQVRAALAERGGRA